MKLAINDLNQRWLQAIRWSDSLGESFLFKVYYLALFPSTIQTNDDNAFCELQKKGILVTFG